MDDGWSDREDAGSSLSALANYKSEIDSARFANRGGVYAGIEKFAIASEYPSNAIAAIVGRHRVT
jgi:hypothetical protein